MKDFLSKIYIWIVVFAISSCDSYLINGDLDGFWQVQTIEHLSSGNKTEGNNNFFYAFQRHIVQLTKHSSYGMEGMEAQYHAGFEWEQDSITMGDFRIYDLFGCKTKAPMSELKKFGLYEEYTAFHIELSKQKLILTSDSACIVLRKY